jgi:hypothetical protein
MPEMWLGGKIVWTTKQLLAAYWGRRSILFYPQPVVSAYLSKCLDTDYLQAAQPVLLN